MTRLVFVLALILLSFLFQFILSNKKNKWLGLIIPSAFFVVSTIFLIVNLTTAFHTIEGYGQFLVGYGGNGAIALFLKTGFIYSPFLVNLLIYILCRHKYKKYTGSAKSEKEIKKMIVDDLD
jgi:hypothetical protein